MKRKKSPEEKIIGVLKASEAGAKPMQGRDLWIIFTWT